MTFMFKKKGEISKIFSPLLTFLSFSFKPPKVLDHMMKEGRLSSSVHKNFGDSCIFYVISTKEVCFLSFVAVPSLCHMAGLFLLSS